MHEPAPTSKQISFFIYKYDIYTKIAEVNSSVFVYKLFQEDFTTVLMSGEKSS